MQQFLMALAISLLSWCAFTATNARAEFFVSSRETIDSFGPMEWWETANPEVVVDSDGDAVLVYHRPEGPHALHFVYCLDSGCATRAQSVLDNLATAHYRSLALDQSGTAHVLYLRRGDNEPFSYNRTLYLAACAMEPAPVPSGPACATTTLTQYTSSTFLHGGHVGMFEPDGRFIWGWVGDTNKNTALTDVYLLRNDNPPPSTILLRDADVADSVADSRPYLFFNEAAGGYQMAWRNFDDFPGFDSRFEVLTCTDADCTTPTRIGHQLHDRTLTFSDRPRRDVELDPTSDTLVVLFSDPTDQMPTVHRCVDPACTALAASFEVDPAGAGTLNYGPKRMTILPDGTIFVAFLASPPSSPADYDLYVVECDSNDVCGPRMLVEAALGNAGMGTDPSNGEFIRWLAPFALDHSDDHDLVIAYADSTPSTAADSELRVARIATRENACDDGVDDDGDGQVDCEDTDCDTSSSCPALSCPCWDGTQDQAVLPGQTLKEAWTLAEDTYTLHCPVPGDRTNRCETTEQNGEAKAEAVCTGSDETNSPNNYPTFRSSVEKSSNPAEDLRCDIELAAGGSGFTGASISVTNLSRPQFRGCVDDMTQFTGVTQGVTDSCGLPKITCPCWDGTQDQTTFSGQTLAEVWESVARLNCLFADTCEAGTLNGEPFADAFCRADDGADGSLYASASPGNQSCVVDVAGLTNGSLQIENLTEAQYASCVDDVIDFTQVASGVNNQCGLPTQ